MTEVKIHDSTGPAVEVVAKIDDENTLSIITTNLTKEQSRLLSVLLVDAIAGSVKEMFSMLKEGFTDNGCDCSVCSMRRELFDAAKAAEPETSSGKTLN